MQILLGGFILKTISFVLGNTPEYALYGTITEYALFFSVLANLGIFATVVKKMADDPLNGKLFVNALFLRVGTAGVLFLVAFGIFVLQGNSAAFLLPAGLFLAALFFDFITSVSDGMLQANYQMGRATLALIIGKFVTLLMIAWTAFGAKGFAFLMAIILRKDVSPWADLHFSISLPAIFGAMLLGSVLTAMVSLFLVSRKIDFEWKIDRNLILNIFKISLPFGLISICNSLYFRFLPDYFAHEILASTEHAANLSSDQVTSAFNVFNVAFRIAQTVSIFSTVLMFSALPGFKQYLDSAHFQKAYKLYRKLLQLLAVSGLLLVAIGTLFANKIIALLTHQDFIWLRPRTDHAFCF